MRREAATGELKMGKLKNSVIDKPVDEPIDDKPSSTAVSTTGSNPWLEYGAAVGASDITGDLLKFSKGDFLAGQDNREIAVGTRLVANMDSLEIGWIKWENSRPADRRMGRCADGHKPAKRPDLGDNDKALWETDDDGSPRDPWQYSNHLILADPEDGQLYTFATSSKGGLTAIGALCSTYGQAMRQHPDQWPIIELGVGSYAHSNKAYGRIKFPTFEVVGWSPKDGSEVSPPTAPGSTGNTTATAQF
jgi:hypothetical protein